MKKVEVMCYSAWIIATLMVLEFVLQILAFSILK